jgi:hypothetical protein
VALDLPPKERNLLAWPVDNELTYWTLMEQLSKAEREIRNKKGSGSP